jgi:hypothetical protein
LFILIGGISSLILSLDLGTGEETVSVEKTQVFVLHTVQTNTIPLQVELHQVIVFLSKFFLSIFFSRLL